MFFQPLVVTERDDHEKCKEALAALQTKLAQHMEEMAQCKEDSAAASAHISEEMLELAQCKGELAQYKEASAAASARISVETREVLCNIDRENIPLGDSCIPTIGQQYPMIVYLSLIS